MKKQSYKSLLDDHARKGPYTGHLIGAALKHFHIENDVFTRDIQRCLLDSDTYAAAQRQDDLKGRFQEDRAVAGWVQWIDKFTQGKAITPPAEAVLIDWKTGIFKHDFDKPGQNPTYGCVVDIRHCVYDRKTVNGRVLLTP
jgi:hypothetical protein